MHGCEWLFFALVLSNTNENEKGESQKLFPFFYDREYINKNDWTMTLPTTNLSIRDAYTEYYKVNSLTPTMNNNLEALGDLYNTAPIYDLASLRGKEVIVPYISGWRDPYGGTEREGYNIELNMGPDASIRLNSYQYPTETSYNLTFNYNTVLQAFKDDPMNPDIFVDLTLRYRYSNDGGASWTSPDTIINRTIYGWGTDTSNGSITLYIDKNGIYEFMPSVRWDPIAPGDIVNGAVNLNAVSGTSFSTNSILRATSDGWPTGFNYAIQSDSTYYGSGAGFWNITIGSLPIELDSN